jgi:hypothetical protein
MLGKLRTTRVFCALISIVLLGTVAAYAQAPAISSGSVTNAADYSRELAPGMIITVWGTNLAPRAAGAAAIPLPTTLEGASVEVIDGSGTVNASGTQLLTIQGTGLWTSYSGSTFSSVTWSFKDIPIGYDTNWQGGLIGGSISSSALSDHVVSFVLNGQSLPATDKPTLTLTFR